MVTVSVPGKVILMGDHAIVHGKPGLIVAINKRLSVSVNRGFGKNDEYLNHIIGIVEKHFGLKKVPNMHISIVSDIPSGYHLGSSAAVAVATIGAIMYFLKKIWNPNVINQLAYDADKFVHKTPSGADNTAITFGGFLWYRKELEFLRSFWQLPMKIPKNFNHFFLIDTGKPLENTGELVAFVSKQKNLPTFLSENEIQTKRMATAIKENDERTFIDAMRKGESTLEAIGVVSKKVIPVIRSIEKSGGAVKILGGGGRRSGVGFLLCYHHEPKKVEGLCKPFGFSIQHITLGEEGVRLERKV